MDADQTGNNISAGEASAMLKKLQGFWVRISSPPREPIDDSAHWYVGLAIDASSFSRQLIQLQKSLHAHSVPAGKSPSKKPVEEAAIKFDSESAA
jgi:hypothetical protein